MNHKALLLHYLFLLLVLSPCLVVAQSPTPSKVKSYLSLSGEVNMLCVFVETDLEDWEEDEMEAYYREYLAAQEWIKEEASFYGQELRFDNEEFYLENKKRIRLDGIYRGDSPSRTLSKVLQELGYQDFEDLMDRHNFDFQQNKMKIVLMVKQNSRSHAFNYWSVKQVDMAIVYCKSTYGMRTDKYVMAHEILHQFGAWDLYFGKSQTRESAKRAAELFPHSIMASTHHNKERLQVDGLTAWRIGWGDYEEDFAYFNPRNHREQAKEELKNRNKDKPASIKFDLKKKEKEN